MLCGWIARYLLNCTCGNKNEFSFDINHIGFAQTVTIVTSVEKYCFVFIKKLALKLLM